MYNLHATEENLPGTKEEYIFIYGYMLSDINAKGPLRKREMKPAANHFMGHSFRLAARDLLHAHFSFHKGRGMCYPVCGMMNIN